MKDYTGAVVVVSVVIVGLVAIGFLVGPHISWPQDIGAGRAYVMLPPPEVEESSPSKFLQQAVEDPGAVRFY